MVDMILRTTCVRSNSLRPRCAPGPLEAHVDDHAKPKAKAAEYHPCPLPATSRPIDQTRRTHTNTHVSASQGHRCNSYTHAPTHRHTYTHVPPLKERAKAEEDGDSDDARQGAGDNDNDDGSGGDEDEDEGLEAAAEQDGLEGEVLRGKDMDVASMDALKKRIEVRRK